MLDVIVWILIYGLCIGNVLYGGELSREKTFVDQVRVTISRKKNFAGSSKTAKSMSVFYLESFPLYGIIK